MVPERAADFGFELGLFLAQVSEKKNILGWNRAIGLELVAPMAVWPLLCQQRIARPGYGIGQPFNFDLGGLPFLKSNSHELSPVQHPSVLRTILRQIGFAQDCHNLNPVEQY